LKSSSVMLGKLAFWCQ